MDDFKVSDESMQNGKPGVDLAYDLLSSIELNEIGGLDSKYASINTDIREAMVLIDEVEDELLTLSNKLILPWEAMIESGIYEKVIKSFVSTENTSESEGSDNYFTVIGYEVINQNKDGGYGAYILLEAINGMRFPIFVQRNDNGKWGAYIDERLKSGCSIFAPSAAICGFVSNKDGITLNNRLVKEVIGGGLDCGGNFGGIVEMFSGKLILHDDAGRPFTVKGKAEKFSYGSGSNRETVIGIWETTHDSGGFIFPNVSARKGHGADVANNNANIKSGYTMDSATKQLKANGGMHVILMGGRTSDDINSPVIFIDSMDTTLINDSHVLLKQFADVPGHKLNVNGEPMSYGDFYDEFGGKADTWSGDSAKWFVAVTDIEIVYLD